MNEKTIDSLTGGHWYVFGTRDSCSVDVCQDGNDLVCEVPQPVAEQLIDARAKFMEEVYALLKDVPYVLPYKIPALTEDVSARSLASFRRTESEVQLRRDLLVQVQKQEYPDSNILSVQDAFSKWPSMPVDLLLSELKDYESRLGKLFDESSLQFLVSEKRRAMVSEYASCVHRSMASAMQHPIFIFYECGKDDHGKYKYKGFRYGTQPSEYASVVTPWG